MGEWSRILIPTREELAWAAGFIEGEGSIRLNVSNNRNGRKYTVPTVDAVQVDREPLDRLANTFCGIGKIYGPYLHSGKGTRLPHFRYIVHSFEGAQAIVAMLWPWLSQRRKQQARTVLSEHRRINNRPKLQMGPKPKVAA